jgi:hypothetical protein
VPLFGGEGAVLGSLSIVFSEHRFPQQRLNRFVAQLKQAADATREGLARYAAKKPGTAVRKSVRKRSKKATRGNSRSSSGVAAPAAESD